MSITGEFRQAPSPQLSNPDGKRRVQAWGASEVGAVQYAVVEQDEPIDIQALWIRLDEEHEHSDTDFKGAVEWASHVG